MALAGTGAVERWGAWAPTAVAVEAQPLVEAAQEAELALSQQAARRPATCASAQLPAAVARVSPTRMIRAIARAIRSPAEAAGRSFAVAHVQPATVRQAVA